jgi:uncharacterized protein YjbI with pentapeptide repeats
MPKQDLSQNWKDSPEEPAARAKDGADTGALRGRDLRNCQLEHVSLEGADLAGATLESVHLGGANLAGALLEDANLCGAHGRFASFRKAVLERADARQADFWGASFDDALLTGTDLRDSKLNECCLQSANLAGADLRGAFLVQANLRFADLSSANLMGADLNGADLTGAVLANANLQNLVLTNTKITHVCLAGASLAGTQLRQDQLGDAIGEELKRDFAGARLGYLALERNFAERGDPDAASWAYRKRRRMQKREALERSGMAWRSRRRRKAIRHALQFAADSGAEVICDYGESLVRVLVSLIAIYFLFAVGFDITGSVVRKSGSTGPTITHNPIDVGLFSFAALTGGSWAAGLEPRNAIVQLFSSLQALLVAGFTGLFGFVLGNRIRR